MNIIPRSPLFVSSLAVEHNAVKNILFRAATIVLDFAVLRIFAFIAFKSRDYTSFLVFTEDIIQKTLYVFSRGFRRQAGLVAFFAFAVGAAGFYDTLLWGLDNPGYILRRTIEDGASLASQMVDSPSYLNYISANLTTGQSNLNATYNADLYKPGLNFTLLGTFDAGTAEVVQPLYPLGPDDNGTARIWLDNGGLAVALDPAFMSTQAMWNSTATACYPSNPPGETTIQTWRCNVPNEEALELFNNLHGQMLIWWDSNHSEYLAPQRIDNPWKSLGSGGGTAMMKQVFTVTRGLRRHTFLETVIKANMLTFPPYAMDDTEIADFMQRTWSNGTMTPAVQTLTNFVRYAKGNETSTTFGAFTQLNTSVASSSTDYLNIMSTATGKPIYTALRYSTTNISLIRSETLDEAPVPFEPCPGVVYRNLATGGVVRSTNCKSPAAENQTVGALDSLFLGQIDVSAVTIINDFLGDGTSNLSSVALSGDGLSWLNGNEARIDDLIISRALLLGGNKRDVKVFVEANIPAISYIQLILCVLPVLLGIGAYIGTSSDAMSYFKSSFLAAVLTTTHVDGVPTSCQNLGYIHSMPEITVQDDGRHISLGTPNGGTISNTGAKSSADMPHLIYEPLILSSENVQLAK